MSDDSPDGAIVVFITAPNKDEAARLAEMLVEKRLAACVQLLPGVESVYRWQGRIEREQEVLLMAKTLSRKFEEISTEVTALHSYETPEIVAVPIMNGLPPYLEWLVASMNPNRK